MASRTFIVALVAMMLIASAAAQATPAHSKSKSSKKCAAFGPGCATCGRVNGVRVCLTCGPNTETIPDGDGVDCPCDAAAGAGTFSPAAWTAYTRGEDKCKSGKGSKHGKGGKKGKCPARPTGCVVCDSYDNCQLSDNDPGKCAYVGGDVTVTSGRRLFGINEDIWA